MEHCYLLTTVDNPYDPYDQFDQWYRYDEDMGYHSCAYLSRVAHTSDLMSPTENREEIKRAIKEIVRVDPFGIYRMVVHQITD